MVVCLLSAAASTDASRDVSVDARHPLGPAPSGNNDLPVPLPPVRNSPVGVGNGAPVVPALPVRTTSSGSIGSAGSTPSTRLDARRRTGQRLSPLTQLAIPRGASVPLGVGVGRGGPTTPVRSPVALPMVALIGRGYVQVLSPQSPAADAGDDVSF